jgi:type I restriction-modification system DNA methylase subunit
MARAVSLEQIKAQNWNLNIKRYLPKQQASLNPNRIAKTLSQLAQQRQQAEQEMDDCIEALGIDLEQSGGHTDSD